MPQQPTGSDRQAFNAGVDAAIAVVRRWLIDGRDEQELLEQLGDARRWIGGCDAAA